MSDMSEAEQRATLAVALMAAFADGTRDERERAAVETLVGQLNDMAGGALDVAAVYQELTQRKPGIAEVVKPLVTQQSRQFAYEAAALALPANAARSLAETASSMAAATLPAVAAAPSPATRPAPDAAALDASILNAAITNAALELLPESLASMAIIPLQMKLVYRIGQAYGYELDGSSVKDFLATLGVGLTAQYLEQFGRKLLGGLLGSVAGGIGRSIGHQAASSGMAFASTWALGQVAKQYYAGGRTLDADKLRAAFGPLLSQARELGTRYAVQIQQRAQGIDLSNLPALISKA